MMLKICGNCAEIYYDEFEFCKCMRELYEQNRKFECVKCGHSMLYRNRCNHREMKEMNPRKVLVETPHAIEILYSVLKKIVEKEIRLKKGK